MIAPKILFFLEDPGAALFLRGLPEALAEAGMAPVIGAIQHAAPYFHTVESVPEASQGDSHAAEALLDRIDPAALIVGTSENPDSFAFPLIEAARRRGLPTIGAVDSAPNAGNRFRGHTAEPLAYAPDWLLVPDAKTSDGFAAHGFDAPRIRICGHPRLYEIDTIRRGWSEADRQAHRRKWFPEAGDRRIIVFVSELSVGLGHNPFLRSERYQLTGTSDRIKRTDIVMEELLLAARSLPDAPYIVLRLHPKQRREDEGDNVPLFDQVSHAEPGLEVVHVADLVVGMTSILLVEAAALGRPVLSIVPVPEERDWLGDVGATIPSVSIRSDITAWLSGAWPPVPDMAAGQNSVAAMTALLRSIVAEEPA